MRLYNTLSRSIEEIKPLGDNTIKLYTCGLTVYSQPHIGNWVGYIYWDVLVRTLRQQGFNVIRTQNYTDVGHLVSDDDSGEDKMEKGARREGLSAWDVAEKYIKIAEREAYGLLGLLRPEHLIRATDYVPQQIAFVETLEKKGYTYCIDNEGIYFDTAKLKDYGKLARLDARGLEAGARVAVAGKRNITDFALWKFSPLGQKRDMEWESPWGKGFPGWHLECSTISRETLGDELDIHCGGIDHIPVHHTNEIAQTESLTGRPFAKIWLHNNHLKIESGKMAKSLGNIYTLQDIIDRGFDIMAYKLLVLSKHYRTEGNFTWENLQAAQNRLKSYRQAADLQYQPVEPSGHPPEPVRWAANSSWIEPFISAMLQDLRTPEALVAVDNFFKQARRGLHKDDIEAFKGAIQIFENYLGLQLSMGDIGNTQKRLLKQRAEARAQKKWDLAGALREELESKHKLGLNDTQFGTTWYRL